MALAKRRSRSRRDRVRAARSLVRDLVRLVIDPDSAANLSPAADEHTWNLTLQTLRLHGLASPAGGALVRTGLIDRIPGQAGTELAKAYQATRFTNATRMAQVAAVLEALEAAGMQPIVMKGAALINTIYDDPGDREMGDVDVLVADEHGSAKACGVVREMGYDVTVREADAWGLRGPGGVVVDLHSRFRLFEGHDLTRLLRTVERKQPPPGRIRVFEPHAQLAHLVAHLGGHAPTTGYMLRWIVDIARLMRSHPTPDPGRASELIPGGFDQTLLPNLTHLIRVDLRCDVPDCAQTETPRTLTLDRVLRSRRLAAWDLPSVRGALRLALHLLRLRRRDVPAPSLPDLLGRSGPV